MKTFKVSAFCAFMVLSGQTFAKPIKSEVTPIVFAKGSHCGSFSGDIGNRQFTLYLNQSQVLEILMDDVRDIFPIVKNSKNKIVLDEDHPHSEYVGYAYFIETKGKHTITFKTDREYKANPYTKVEFCAY
ncbi:hypothetical protein [Faucicola boevrei]|uniref:hypothetical protein n=1 Tax=Faucicola boevrei TaxID=346665 RepID=UPI000366DAB4|nr:hypothetical protein [Moraxella boevrei]